MEIASKMALLHSSGLFYLSEQIILPLTEGVRVCRSCIIRIPESLCLAWTIGHFSCDREPSGAGLPQAPGLHGVQ